jgi:hypothetical protein
MFAATLEVNSMGCMNVPGRRRNAAPGAVCVTAFLDADDVVRAVRIERLFPSMDSEVFRKALVRKYGPVATARSSLGLALGWGPEVAPALGLGGARNALLATFAEEEDMMSRSLNRAQDIHVTLQLVDAAWAAKQATR